MNAPHIAAHQQSFNEDEIDLCLDAAVEIRRSFLGGDGREIDEYKEEYAKAKSFDNLAAKIAHVAGVELERDCGCIAGKTEHGTMCLDCIGTGVIPPRRQ